MSRAKIEVTDTGNIGISADFGSETESEDDDWERKQIEKEDEEIRDFVKNHSLPPREDFYFWKTVLDRFISESGLPRIKDWTDKNPDIIKIMYENLVDKNTLIQCGKELNAIGGMDSMIINHYQSSSFINSDGWNEWYKQVVLNANKIGWTLVGWKKLESIKWLIHNIMK